MKKKNFFLLLCLAVFLCGGCAGDKTEPAAESIIAETVPSGFPEGQRLKLKVTPGNGYGGMAISVPDKGSTPHVSGVEDTWIYWDGNFVDLGEAIAAELITVEEMDAYAKLDAKNGFCRMEYTSLNGLSLYVYHYEEFDVASYYDVFESPDGRREHVQKFILAANNNYTDVNEFSVDYPHGVREDWGLSFVVKEAVSDHITLQITQSGGQHFGELQIGPSLYLEKDNGGTFKEPFHQTQSSILRRKDSVIPEDATTEFVIPWPRSCSELPDGEYTMHIRIEDHFDPEQVHPFTRDYADHQVYQIDFVIGNSPEGIRSVELFSSPVSVEAVVVRIGDTEYETVETVETVTLTSALLTSNGITIEFIPPEPVQTFDCLYLNVAQFYGVPYVDVDAKENIYAAMKYGKRIEFFQSQGGKDSVFLSAGDYIDFFSLESIVFPDGTEIKMPDTW